MTPLLASVSESFQQWFVMRLSYFTLIWPPQLERPLKSLLGNTTHVVRSFQLLYYSNKQLLFVTSKPPHPSSPPQQTMRWALISFLKRQNSAFGPSCSAAKYDGREWPLPWWWLLSSRLRFLSEILNYRPNYTCNSQDFSAWPQNVAPNRIFLLLQCNRAPGKAENVVFQWPKNVRMEELHRQGAAPVVELLFTPPNYPTFQQQAGRW